MPDPTATIDRSALSKNVIGIILAGGFGTRLQGVRPDCPKPLIPCLNKPFIEWVMLHAHRSGINQFVISLGHLSEVARRYFDQRSPDALSISTVVESSPLGTAGAIRFAWDAYQGQSALVLNGDSLLLGDFGPLWKLWATTTADAVVVGVPQSDASRFGTLTFSSDQKLLAFEEKRPGAGIINAGIYLFRPELLRTIPLGVALSVERDIFPSWLKEGRDIRVCQIPGPFLDIGLPESLASADEFLRLNWSSVDREQLNS